MGAGQTGAYVDKRYEGRDFVLKAQEVLRLAEGPIAIPTAAPAPLAATGVDAAAVVGDRERPLPVRRDRVEADRPEWGR